MPYHLPERRKWRFYLGWLTIKYVLKFARKFNAGSTPTVGRSSSWRLEEFLEMRRARLN